MRPGTVGAWSYVWPYTIEANGTSGDPIAPARIARAARRLYCAPPHGLSTIGSIAEA